MRRANVYCRSTFAGVLSKDAANNYRFEYAREYLLSKNPAISLSFPKQESAFESATLFPFFFGLLAEGEDMVFQCRLLNIDENDYFTRLLKTCNFESIGGITISEAEEP